MKTPKFILFAAVVLCMISGCSSSRKQAAFSLSYERYSYEKQYTEAEARVNKGEKVPAENIPFSTIIISEPGKISLLKDALDKEQSKEKTKESVKVERAARKQILKALVPSAKQGVHEDRTFFLNFILVVLAIILPPLAVLLVDGLRGPFWLSILLTLLLYVPGLIYAIYRIFRTS